MRDYVWNIDRRVDCEIFGTVPWYPTMRNHRVAQGRFFSEYEMDEKSSVCVLGAETASRLFPLASPLGQTVRVGERYYRVIGVMHPQAKNSKADEAAVSADATPSLAHRMFIPLATARTRYGEILRKRRSGSFEQEKVALHEVTVKVARREEVVNVSAAIKGLLDRNHKKEDYQMIVPLELLKRAGGKRIFTSCWAPSRLR